MQHQKHQVFIKRSNEQRSGFPLSIGRENGVEDIHIWRWPNRGVAIALNCQDELYYCGATPEVMSGLQVMLAIALHISQNFEAFWQSPVEFIYALPEAVDHEIYFQDEAP